MKKLLLIAFSVILLTSCSKDDDATIVGKWYTYKTTSYQNGQETVDMYVNECPTKKDYVKFQNDGVLESYYFDDQCIENLSTFFYTIDGTDLTIDGEVFEVVLLTGKSLKIKSYSDTPGDYDIIELKK